MIIVCQVFFYLTLKFVSIGPINNKQKCRLSEPMMAYWRAVSTD